MYLIYLTHTHTHTQTFTHTHIHTVYILYEMFFGSFFSRLFLLVLFRDNIRIEPGKALMH